MTQYTRYPVLSSGGGGSEPYTEVPTYADLPPYSSVAGQIYVVQTSTGIWPLTKNAGLYRSTGAQWDYLGSQPDTTSLKANGTTVTGAPINLVAAGSIVFTPDAGTNTLTIGTVGAPWVSGGNSFGSISYLGTNDDNTLVFQTNDVDRGAILNNGKFLIGTSSINDFSNQPSLIGEFKFDVANIQGAFQSNEFYHYYYGSSGLDRQGILQSLNIKPGETYYTASGEYTGAKYFTSASTGLVATIIGVNSIAFTGNSSGTIGIARSIKAQVQNTNGGVVRDASGLSVGDVVATGTDANKHYAAGLLIGENGASITASGSSDSNTAYGILVRDKITATGTNAKAYAIKSESVAPSELAGTLTATVTYAPADTSKWVNPQPTTIQQAIDRIAAVVGNLTPIP
jgi:hypothetical protein